MFDPSDNARLGEGHIREALFSFDSQRFFEQQQRANGTTPGGSFFRRETLLESTALVMSPLELEAAGGGGGGGAVSSLKEARMLTCRVEAGDIFYLPAFWWGGVGWYS